MRIEMKREYISPERAKAILQTNRNVRRVSNETVNSYAADMRNGLWTEETGTAISIDTNGNLVDGQHRLNAIIKSNTGITTWVCYGCEPNGVYDENYKRNLRSQLNATSNLPKLYSDTRVASCVRILRNKSANLSQSTKISTKSYTEFVLKHAKEFDTFFSALPLTKVRRISRVSVFLSLFTAFCGGVDLDEILRFYEVLRTGMPNNEYEKGIIVYRNWLLNRDAAASTVVTDDDVARCQNALLRYLNREEPKMTRSRYALIWPWPWTGKVASA